MECERCGLVAKAYSVDNTCPFCGAAYSTPTAYPVIIPSNQHAREMRDLYTWLAHEVTFLSLGDDWEDIKRVLYHTSQEMAEYYDELVNRDN